MKFDDLTVLKSHPIQRPAVLISENILYFSVKAFNFFEKEIVFLTTPDKTFCEDIISTTFFATMHANGFPPKVLP